jgi:hypothetical protein
MMPEPNEKERRRVLAVCEVSYRFVVNSIHFDPLRYEALQSGIDMADLSSRSMGRRRSC